MSIAPRETKCLSSCQRAPGAVAVGALREDAVLRLDRRRVAERAARGRARAPRAALALDDVRRRRDDLRDHVAGAQHDHLLAGPDVLAREVLLVVKRRQLDRHAAHGDGLEHAHRGAGRRTCRRSTSPSRACVTAVVGGNFHATAQRGSRPTEPSRRCSSRSSTLTTTPSISKSSSPRRRCHSQALRDHLVLAAPAAVMSRLTRKPCSRSQSSACEWRSKERPRR